MKWTSEAESAIKKVPFFVRKRVRNRVEQEAASSGKHTVDLSDVKAAKRRYLNNMSSEVKGWRLDVCFGPNGCPNRSATADSLMNRLEAELKRADLLNFLKQTVGDRLKFHHEFRISVAECPNACSQPQIKDIGIIGACAPELTDIACTLCEACIDSCPDDAVKLDTGAEKPVIDDARCLACGKCIAACPTGTIGEYKRGYKILLGGKLGRHPRLAVELPHIFDEDKVVNVVKTCIDFYKANSRHGKRFSELLDGPGFETLLKQLDFRLCRSGCADAGKNS